MMMKDEVGEVENCENEDDDEEEEGDDIYIMMRCLSVCHEKSSLPPWSLL